MGNKRKKLKIISIFLSAIILGIGIVYSVTGLSVSQILLDQTSENVTETAYVQQVPQNEEDEYFEVKTEEWVSYINPRDRYKERDYHGNEERNVNGKMCVTLVNENHDPVIGETLENTSIHIDTKNLSWHSEANPFEVKFPLYQNYDRPLESDQLGVSDDLPQGNGYLDSHCIEWHYHHPDKTIEYEKPKIQGNNRTDIELIGIKEHSGTWNSNLSISEDYYDYSSDNIEGVLDYNYEEGNTHAQAHFIFSFRSDS